MREAMTPKEQEQLKALQAKQKRIARHDSEFRAEVLERRNEVIELLELDKTFEHFYEEKVKELIAIYRAGNEDTLFRMLSNENIVNTIRTYFENKQ